MKILIIEDEPQTAIDLAQTLKKAEPAIEIENILESVHRSVEYLTENPMPELIYMDIQLADGLSFDIFKQVKITCPVIFCTAYDEYALNAFKLNGIDFILKPFDLKSVRASLEKINLLKEHFQKEDHYAKSVSSMIHSFRPGTKSSFLVNHKGKMIPVATSDIAYFFIADELTFLFTFDEQKYIVNYSLEVLEGQVDSQQFYRANRQYLINFGAIREVEPYFNRKLVVKLNVKCKEQILVGKLKVTSFREWLTNR
ncbi:response regulator [Maribellus comscasis]|uniref:Response regulator n=1 Tax=Maribellus comscasis TaxID=2681766 RepID=A0A6I6JP79_9BACT|nr:LytTR family DNA-binding domain-containing protein [Maribellus comscasis]QGY44786.1 response regulator [Maribellus comscasis]